MQKKLLFYFGVILVGCVIISLSEARTPRSRIRSTTTTTTSAPSTSTAKLFSSSSTTSKSVSSATLFSNSTSRPRGRRILRRRRPGAGGVKRFRKRQGPVSFDDENSSSQQEQNLYNREALYERPEQRTYRNPEEFDDYDKSPYYSPIKRQRNKVTPRFQDQKPRQFNEHVSALNPYPTPTSASHVSPYSTDPQDFDHPDHDFPPPQPAPKNYAFAYAVRDDNNAEDFSHKEARDGKLTMGEYRINLPDGRVQVVRYTAGGTIGYKADVTYEGDDPRNKDLAKSIPPSGRPRNAGPTGGPSYSSYSPTSSVPKKFKPHPTSDPYGDEPSYVPRRKKARRPSSVSPTSNYPSDNPYYLPASPTPSVYSFGSSPSPRPTSESFYNGIGSTARPKSIYDKIPPSSGKPNFQQGTLSYQHDHSPRAGPSKNGVSSSRYQVEAVPTKEPSYSNSGPTKEPYYSNFGPTKAAYYDDNSAPPGPPYYSPISPTASSSIDGSGGFSYKRSSKPSKVPKKQVVRNYHEEDTNGPSTYTPIRSSKSGGLIPINDFKAGPSSKKFKNGKSPKSNIPNFRSIPKSDQYSQQGPTSFPSSNGNYQYVNLKSPGPTRSPPSYNPTYDSPPSVKYKEPFHYYNSQHPSYHHGGFTGPQSSPTPPVGMHQLHVNPTAAAYNIDYPGGGKQSYYYKTGPGGSSPKPGRRNNRKHKTSSGLVYLETPGEGPRPTDQGVQDILSRLPNMPSNREPSSKTTIHAYEVGSKDYGNSVGYKNSETPSNRYNDNGDHSSHHDDFNHHDYVPQLNTNHFDDQGHHSHESLGNYHRDYLYDSSPDSIVQPQPEILPEPTVDSGGVDQSQELGFQY